MSIGKLLMVAVVGGGVVWGGSRAYEKAQPVLAEAHAAEVKAAVAAGQKAMVRVRANDEAVQTAEEARAKAAKNLDLRTHLDRATPAEAQNIRLWGHFWDPSAEETAARQARFTDADAAEQALNIMAAAQPPEGVDPRPYNERIGQAYQAWASAQRAAYGADWRGQWESRHGYARTAPSLSTLLRKDSDG